ncbi:MAG: glycosyltransferase family 2 protein [Chordicoccus sp.]
MAKGIVSVVLPIYNVEKYLNRCVDSVVNQSYKNLEIILVDDGSPDNCPAMCDEWAQKDNRIKVIHKKNAGLGYARNTGIDNATGEYICFFDSDDYIARNAIEKAYNLAIRERADIVTFGYCSIGAGGETNSMTIPEMEKVTYSGNEVQDSFLADLIGPDVANGKWTNLHMSAWASMYSLPIIKEASWRFASEREIISEDVYSLLDLYKNVRRVSVLPEALYFYCDNAGSLTHIYKPDRYSKNKEFYNACYQLAEKNNYSKNVRARLAYPYVSNTIAAMQMIVLSDMNRQSKEQEIKKIVTDSHLQRVLRSSKYAKEKLPRKLLVTAMKNGQYRMCYQMIRMKEKWAERGKQN